MYSCATHTIQWAAVTTQFDATRVPPQLCRCESEPNAGPAFNDTIQGYFPLLKKHFNHWEFFLHLKMPKKIFFLPWNPLRRQFCAPPPNHICMLSLTISNDVDDVDDVDDRELDFKSIKRQKAKSNTHTHTHTQENEPALKSETCASCFSLCALATFLERGPGGFDRLDCQSFCPSTLARF